MKRSVVLIAALAAFSGAGYSFYLLGVRPDYDQQQANFWLMVAVVGGLTLVGIVLAVWGSLDNFYNVRSGTVLDHRFVRAHMTPPTLIYVKPSTMIIPGHWEEDDWAIKLQDDSGHTGWLHFRVNVFSEYPIGSKYLEQLEESEDSRV